MLLERKSGMFWSENNSYFLIVQFLAKNRTKFNLNDFYQRVLAIHGNSDEPHTKMKFYYKVKCDIE